MPRRSASSLAFCAVATAVAALAAKACSSRSSSSLNGRSPLSRSNTIRKPTGRLRNDIGVTIADRAPSSRAAKESGGTSAKRCWRPVRQRSARRASRRSASACP